MIVLTANIASKRARVRQLVAAIHLHKPNVVLVTEAYHARWWLLLIWGYRLRQFQGREASGVAWLVRRDQRIVRRWPMRMSLRWHGPHGRRHQPRVLPVLVLDDDHQRRWWLCGVHAPWPHGTAAWLETFNRVTRWLADHDGAAAPGDWNATVGELSRELGERPGLELVVGTKVDHVLTKGLEHGPTQRLGQLQPEGMHGWVVYRLQGTGA